MNLKQIQTMNQTKNPMTRTTFKLFFSKNKIKETLKQTTGPKICVNNNSHPLGPILIMTLKSWPVYVIDAKIIVYDGEQDKYFSFITPEAYWSL